MQRPVSSQVPKVPVATFWRTLSSVRPEKGEFPIVNGARAVGGQVGHPAALDEPVHDPHRAVLDQVRAIHQDHAGIPLAGGGDVRARTPRIVASAAASQARGG